MKTFSTFLLALTLLVECSGVLFLAPSQARADITSNLIAHWTFDEGTGATAADSSGNGYDAGLLSTATWTTGHIGAGALDIVDSTSRALVSSVLGSPSTPITITAWVNITTRDLAGSFLSFGGHEIQLDSNGDSSGLRLTYEGSGCANFGFCQTNSSTNVEDTGWRHVAFVLDPGNSLQEIYVDGVIDTTTTHSNAFVGWDFAPYTHVCFGEGWACDGAQSHWVLGALDDVRVYERALTGADIAELYAFTGEESPARIIRLRGRVQIYGGTHLR